jgi:hypothetical protein
MSLSEGEAAHGEEFARRAQDFASFVEETSRLPLPVCLGAARELSCDYTEAALRLPRAEVAHDDVEAAEPARPDSWQGFGEADLYWEVFDPYENEPPVATTLSDDILDVHRDIGRGLALWDAGSRVAALWEWHLSFEIHWGDHAIDALRALHRACKRHAV